MGFVKSFVQEFKEFAVKGNVIDLAVGVIIGGAFGKITNSLVADIVTPPLGLLTGGVNFTDIKITLKQAAEGADAVTLNIGNFVQTVFDFSLMALAVFVMIKFINRLKRQKDDEILETPEPEVAPAPPAQEVLLAEIRDLLKAGGAGQKPPQA